MEVFLRYVISDELRVNDPVIMEASVVCERLGDHREVAGTWYLRIGICCWFYDDSVRLSETDFEAFLWVCWIGRDR